MQRNTMIKVLIFSFLIIFDSILYAQEVKIVHPSDGYITTSKKIHVVFFVDQIQNPKLILNNVEQKLKNPLKYKTKDKEVNVYMMDVNINRGGNKIQIINGKSSETIGVQFLTSAVLYRDRIKRSTFFHQSDVKNFCQNCHNFESLKDCSICHKDKTSAKFVHGPVATLNCNQCHDKNNFFSIIQPVSKRCLTCHDDFNKKFYNFKFVHGPVGAGICTVCHNPHASNDKMLLYDTINNLCENCHSDKKTGVHILANFNGTAHPTSGKYVKALREFLSCASCHDPHYGSSKMIFRDGIKDFLTLCVKCHKDKL